MRPRGALTIGAVFRFAIATSRAGRDPTADLRGALITPTVTHRATIVEPKAVGALLRAIDGFEGHAVTRFALKLAPLVFVRRGELRQAEWAEFDLADAEWRISAKKMKMRRPHRVPLAPQALAVLRELQEITGGSKISLSVGAILASADQRQYAERCPAPSWIRQDRIDHSRSVIHRVNIVERKWQMACGCDRASTCAPGGERNPWRLHPCRRILEGARADDARWADELDRLKDLGRVIKMSA